MVSSGSSSSNEWRERLIAFAPLLLWSGVIFFLSSSAGSFSETSRFIGPILRFLFPDAPPETLAFYHGLVRKMAHVCVYALLAILVVRAIKLRNASLAWSATATFTLPIVLMIGGLDEINQSFLATRTGSPWDVLLDLVGGVLGFLTAISAYRLRARRWRIRTHVPAPE